MNSQATRRKYNEYNPLKHEIKNAILLQILENAVRASSYGYRALITQIMGYHATPSLGRRENIDD